MCSTCCALGVVGIHCVQRSVFVTFVVNRPFGRLGVEGKILLRRVLNRNDWEYFGVPQDGISDTPQNDNNEMQSMKQIAVKNCTRLRAVRGYCRTAVQGFEI